MKDVRKHMFRGAAVLAIALAAAFGTGCDSNDGKAEEFGESIDEAVSSASDAVKDAAEETGDKIKDAGDKIEEKLDND